jgi:uncharacterized membrane protein (DUF485 family)
MNIDRVARAGYLARAFVYLLMGGFALLLTFGKSEGATTDPRGALRKLMDQPLGHFFLGVLALGLFCYAVWRFIQSYKDPEHKGTKLKGWVVRVGYAIGGLTHLMLGIYAVKLLLNMNSKSGTDEKGMTQWLLSQPFGQLLTIAVGLIIVGFGVSQLYIGFKEKFEDRLQLPTEKRSVLCSICKFGLIARGLVLALIGTFFVQAGRHFNSEEAGGISEAWKVLRGQPYGNYLIVVVALGFIAFAVYGLLESVYQKPLNVHV